ncbi:MAG: FAD-dependent oxidoreductase [Rhizomicrobium sp.]
MSGAGDIADVVIVGSGVAGLCAARRAQQLGLRAIVLERHDSAPGFGNGRISGGWFHAAMWDPKIRTPDELYNKVMDETGGHARADVVRAWANNVRRAYRFLAEEGAPFGVLNPAEEAMQNVLLPQRDSTVGRGWRDKGPDILLSKMHAAFVAAGGDHRIGHRAVAAERIDGGYAVRVRTATSDSFVRGRNLLLCDGGFQGNPELVAKYITPHYKLRGSPNDTGDALRIGLSLGAKCVNMEWFYGYALSRDALTDDRLWPLPAPGALIYTGLLVDGHGERFVDESAKGERVANAIARSRTPDNCWAIFDSSMWEREGRYGDVPANPLFVELAATLLEAGTIGELAEKAGLPRDAVVRNVEAVNAYWASAAGPAARASLYEVTGVPGEEVFEGPARKNDGAASGAALLAPPRSPGGRALSVPPYFAMPVIAGITFAMGGLAVTPDAQIVDMTDRPIPGLYAAGGAMGGLQGGPRLGVAGGWSEASTFGILAAERIAAEK